MTEIKGLTSGQTTGPMEVNGSTNETLKTSQKPSTGILRAMQASTRSLTEKTEMSNRAINAQGSDELAKAEQKVAEAESKVAEVKSKIEKQTAELERLESEVTRLKDTGPLEELIKARDVLKDAREARKNINYGELSRAQIELNDALEKLEAINKKAK